MFRALRADEVELRISQVSKDNKKCALLLYKDARCDMTVLDETVGPMNWKREHTRDNANCTISIWDSNKGQWVGKEDTGTESKTEAEKGLASDSFKRAGTNWGIGRELYTAPPIWVSFPEDFDEFERKRAKFWLKEMDVENHIIKHLKVNYCNKWGDKTDSVAFEWPRTIEQKPQKAPRATKKAEPKDDSPIPGEPVQNAMNEPTDRDRMLAAYPSRDEMIEACKGYYKGQNLMRLYTYYHVTGFDELTDEQVITCYNTAMKGIAKQKGEQ